MGFTMLFVDGWFSVNVDPLIWNMEMFRGLSVSWSERAAVWPVRERGVPAAGRLIASNEKNGENKMREGRARKKTKQA